MGFLTILGTFAAFSKALWKKQSSRGHCICGLVAAVIAVLHMITAIGKAGMMCYATWSGLLSIIVLVFLTVKCSSGARKKQGWKKGHILYASLFAATIVIHLLLLKF